MKQKIRSQGIKSPNFETEPPVSIFGIGKDLHPYYLLLQADRRGLSTTADNADKITIGETLFSLLLLQILSFCPTICPSPSNTNVLWRRLCPVEEPVPINHHSTLWMYLARAAMIYRREVSNTGTTFSSSFLLILIYREKFPITFTLSLSFRLHRAGNI